MARQNRNRHGLILAAAFIAMCILANPSANAQLVGHWAFDNSANVGQATVSSNLQAVGGASYSAAGQIGGALSLDGAGDYLNVGAGDPLASGLPTGDSSYTLSTFVQTTTGSRGMIGWGNYGSNGQVNAFRTTGSGLLNYGWSGSYDYSASAPSVLDGTWHSAIATYDATTDTKRLYFDGSEIGFGMTVPNLAVGAANFRIGSTNTTGSGEFFNGLIDDTAVWSEALSGDETAGLVAVATSGDLMYDASTFDLLKQIHDTGSGSVVIGDLAWEYASGLTGTGLSGSDDDFSLVLNSTAGTGLTSSANAVPEPASIALWSLLGLSLAGYAYIRRRKR